MSMLNELAKYIWEESVFSDTLGRRQGHVGHGWKGLLIVYMAGQRFHLGDTASS